MFGSDLFGVHLFGEIWRRFRGNIKAAWTTNEICVEAVDREIVVSAVDREIVVEAVDREIIVSSRTEDCS